MLSFTVTDVDDDDVSSVDGAGILLFTIKEGKLCFLLAREAWEPRTQLPWSGFEGGAKKGETAMETAAREFIEESMGSVRGMVTYQEVLSQLKNGDYFCKIDLEIQRTSRRSQCYTTFLKQIPYDEDLPKRFGTIRRRLKCAEILSTKHKTDELRLLYNRFNTFFAKHPAIKGVTFNNKGKPQKIDVAADYLEKDRLAYWTFDDVRQCMNGEFSHNRMKAYFIGSLCASIHEVERAFYKDTRTPLDLITVSTL